jgi:tRNA pseudouridine55 synthase
MQDPSPSGILLIDKPAGISSFDIIRNLRRQTGLRKFGHAGTLDPAATGLMIILVGNATKRALEFSKQDKTYQATVCLGANSTTGDREGELMPVSNHVPSDQELQSALESFKGTITQTPSKYSAIKINGLEAYKRARKGEAFSMPTREVTINSLILKSYEYPILNLTADVSSGTYIRTLAQDIGEILKTGAYLKALRRTKIGQLSINQASELAEVTPKSLPSLIKP